MEEGRRWGVYVPNVCRRSPRAGSDTTTAEIQTNSAYLVQSAEGSMRTKPKQEFLGGWLGGGKGWSS